mmetsp:Transcript_14835/g.27810  ORF Transcript_14835/g.27810 Transcript_14835/m.27810 type:complete len:260 (+) Transcript_14835:247-1026(+)
MINIQCIVYTPVHLSNFSGWMVQSLDTVLQNHVRTKSNHQSLNCVKHGLYDVRTLFKDIWPHKIQQMKKSILASMACYTKSKVFDCCTTSLTVDGIAIHQSILEKGCHCVHIVLPHFTNVFKHETQRLEDSILNVDFWNTIFVHKSREDSEGAASLRNNGYSYCCTNTHVAVLDFEVVQESVQDVLWTNGSGDEPECANCSTFNGLLVRLEHLQQFKTDSHPLLCRNKFCSPVGNTSNQINAVLLHFLVSVPQDRGQSG